MNNTIRQRSAHGEQEPKTSFSHMLSNIVGYLYIKANEEQNSVSEEDLKNNITLDSGSLIDIFRNIQVAADINRSNQVLRLSTDLGYKINQIQSMAPDYVKVRCDDNSMDSIFSHINSVNKYRVIYDSHQYGAFTVYTNRGIVKSRRNNQGLYVFNPTYTTANSNAVTIVEEIWCDSQAEK